MVTDQLSNVIDVGTFNNKYDFDPSASITNLNAPSFAFLGFVRKLNAVGNFVWVKSIGNGVDHFNIANVVAETNGDIVMMGSFEGTVDFDPNSGVQNLTAISRDLFVLKLNASGNFV
jgi:hypothetical protein